MAKFNIILKKWQKIGFLDLEIYNFMMPNYLSFMDKSPVGCEI